MVSYVSDGRIVAENRRFTSAFLVIFFAASEKSLEGYLFPNRDVEQINLVVILALELIAGVPTRRDDLSG